MAHILKPPAGKILEEAYSGTSYISPITQKTECVAFIQAVLPDIGSTTTGVEESKVTKDDLSVLAGKAIATFIDGAYPGPKVANKHAAIYLGQNQTGIQVLDQWASQGQVLKRTIRWTGGPSISNNGSAFSVIK